MWYNKSMKIVLFGGTFDPPHVEHVRMAEEAVRELQPDLLLVMPTFLPPHKETLFAASAADRLEMCRLAFSDIPCARVSDYEISRARKSYSYLTVRAVAKKYPGAEILFLMGTDMLETFDKWKNPEKILRYSLPVLCEREGEGTSAAVSAERFSDKFGVRILRLGYVGKKVSSTDYKIDRLLGLPALGRLPGRVEDYVEEKGLYFSFVPFSFLRERLKMSRLVHTAGVIRKALELCAATGVSRRKAFAAAALHDCAKYEDPSDYPGFRLPEGVPRPVVHQFLGAYVAETVLGEKDEEVLDAVRYHTSGKPGMSVLGKIIFVADMIEENRNYPEVDELRAKVKESFEEGFILCLERSYRFVVQSGKPVFPLTRKAAEFYRCLPSSEAEIRKE